MITQKTAAAPPVNANDRLGMTLFFAVLFHGVFILGITFISSPSAKQKTPPTLDVILVNSGHKSSVEKADYLAQISQDGGGNSEEKVRRTDMFSAPSLAQQPGLALQQSVSLQAALRQSQKKARLTQEKARHKIKSSTENTHKNSHQALTETSQSNKIPARLAEELSLVFQQYAQKPKEKFINSRTKEYVAATYMRNWIDKIERLGNADYPDAAIRNKLSGTLILNVAINADGSLLKIELRRSSGHKILDDAARRIVEMASPFRPFPKKLQLQADILHITRSWEFLSNHELKSH
jgi:protein TonB